MTLLPVELPLVPRQFCSLKRGRTEKVEAKVRHLKTHIVLFFYQQHICIGIEPSLAATLLLNSKKGSLTKLFV